MSALTPLYIKNAYKDEPSFRDSKIVISLYDDSFEGTLAEGFKSKLTCKEMPEEAIAELASPVSHKDLIMLAIRNCDGVIINGDNVPAEFIEYAESLGKAILPKQDLESTPDACYSFYSKLLGEE
jgi:starch synthase